MRLKRTLVSVLAALGLGASLMAPVAMAQPPESTTSNNDQSARVTVNDTGSFDVYLARDVDGLTPITGGWTDFGVVPLSATQPEQDVTAPLYIVYTDTMSWRPGFLVQLSATSPTVSATSATIDRSNLTIEATSGVAQNQTDTPIAGLTTNPCSPTYCDIGDIGTFVDEADPGGQPTPIEFRDWTANQSLEQARKVHYAYEGVGTDQSGGGLTMGLHIPAGTDPGTYTFTFNVQVISGTP